MPVNPRVPIDPEDFVYVQMSGRLARALYHMCIVGGLASADRVEFKMALEACAKQPKEVLPKDWEERLKRAASRRGCSEADLVFDDRGNIEL